MTEPPPSDAVAPRFRTGWLLQRAYRHARRDFIAGLAPTRLEPLHFGVLLTLTHAQPLSQTELAQRNNSDRTAMVRALDDLERLGCVVRRQSARDRRSNDVTITPAGREAFAAAQTASVAVTDRLFGVLSPQERRQLDALLTKVIDHIEDRPDSWLGAERPGPHDPEPDVANEGQAEPWIPAEGTRPRPPREEPAWP
jgi:DNA-binding MarR family transcriptional regulator